MGSTELLFICISAFIAVFILLALLALVMRAIILVFPQKALTGNAAVLAAISATVASHYPGTKITKIEEIK